MGQGVFEGWKGGEFALLGARQAGRELDGSFTAVNMARYLDGTIGPRAGLRALSVTGLPNGTVQGMGTCSRGVWVLIDDTVYDFPTTGGAATGYTMNDSVSDTFLFPGESAGAFTLTYLSVYAGNAYRIDHTARTVDKLNNGGDTDVPSGSRTIQFVGDRLVFGGTFATPQRVFYSEGLSDTDPPLPQWETFLAEHWFDVSGLVVTGMFPFRDGLLLSSAAGTFTLLTGTVGAPSETTRIVTRQGSPSDPTKGAVLGSGEVVYMGQGRPWPEIFNGALTETFEWEQFAGSAFFDDTGPAPRYRALKLTNATDWIMHASFVSGSDLRSTLLRFDDVFTRHVFGVEASAYAELIDVNLVLFAVDGDVSTAPTFFTWQVGLDRPGYVSDTFAQPGDDSDDPVDAHLYLPEVWDENGHEIMLRSVIVDFHKWNAGSGTNNHFDLKVRALNRFTLQGANDSAVQSFDEGESAVDGDGEDQRKEFNFGDQGYGTGFQLLFDNISGVSIRSVSWLTEDRPQRPARVT